MLSFYRRSGDQYDEKNWDCGIDTAVLSGFDCVVQMMGTSYEEEIFPLTFDVF